MIRVHLLALAIGLLLGGCSLTPPSRINQPHRDANCVDLYARFDQAVEQYQRRNSAAAPVPGYPYLRVNRFLQNRLPQADTAEQRGQWLQLAAELDIELRRLEWRTLPQHSAFKQKWDHEGVLQDHLQLCAATLAGQDRYQPDFWSQLQQRAKVPSDYRTLYRIPFYPLAVPPVAYLTEKARQEFRGWFAQPFEALPVEGELHRYTPVSAARLSPAEVQRILQQSRDNPLRIPQPTSQQAERLLATFAPELVIDTRGPQDRIGTLRYQGPTQVHDHSHPTVYTYLSHTLLAGQPALQLNYAFWYTAREGEGAPWIERGPLDGMTLRYTLDANGQLVMVDGMNSCGCYHFFIPAATVQQRPHEALLKPGPFVPRALPEGADASRLQYRINGHWHQLQQLRRAGVMPDVVTRVYQLQPYQTLEALPDGEGGYVSLFRPDGVARSSPRAEFLLLFPMGIPDVGSMRQRGHHPISLIGRDTFDEPDLMDRYFIFDAP